MQYHPVQVVRKCRDDAVELHLMQVSLERILTVIDMRTEYWDDVLRVVWQCR